MVVDIFVEVIVPLDGARIENRKVVGFLAVLSSLFRTVVLSVSLNLAWALVLNLVSSDGCLPWDHWASERMHELAMMGDGRI